MDAVSATAPKKTWHRRAWRLAKSFLIGYLLIALGMMFIETWLVYPIPSRSWGNWEPTTFKYQDVEFRSADGTKLHGWFLPREGAKRAILYCHGNGEDVALVSEFAAMLSQRLNAAVFVFDYRGYGLSEGRPNEAGCIADGIAAQEWLAKHQGIAPKDVILYGRSLGSAVALAAASKNGARALVMECAFPTMPDVAAKHYPWLPVRWLMRNRYDNLARIQQYQGPLLQSHGTADSLIPIGLAKSLFESSPSEVKQWIELPGRGHNDPPPQSFYAAASGFLDGIDRKNTAPK